MNQAIETLFTEHATIISAVDTANKAAKLVGKNDEQYDKIVRQLIDFFRSYADGLHHHKEEEIFFPALAAKNEFLKEGVLKEMLENHEDFRTMIKDIETALDNKNYPLVAQNLEKYTEALLDHIAVENDEVFQMAESLFSEDELDKMYYQFMDCDRESGEEKGKILTALLTTIEQEIEQNA